MEDAELRNILFSIQGSIAGFQNDMSDVKNDIADMKTDIANMKTDITNMKTDITNMKTVCKLDQNNSDILSHGKKHLSEVLCLNFYFIRRIR